MRSEYKELGGYGLIVLFCLYILGLFSSGTLLFYIHPRYELFAVIVTGLCFGLATLGFIVSLWQLTHKKAGAAQSFRFQPIYLLVIALLAIALVLPPRTLTSHIAKQRNLDFNGAIQLETTRSAAFLQTDSSKLTIKEWVAALRNTPSTQQYVGKPVRVIGFAYQNENEATSTMRISRFVVTCCAVDARPIGLPVHQPDWQKQFAADTWLEVTGVWEMSETGLIIKPTNIQPVPQPKDPYAF